VEHLVHLGACVVAARAVVVIVGSLLDGIF
jgi:hypothetical protein